MRVITKFFFICLLLCSLASSVSATVYTDVTIGHKISLGNDKSIILNDISENQKTLWHVVDANNRVLQKFGEIGPLGSFSYDNYFFEIGNVFSPGRWDHIPEGKVSPLRIKKIVKLEPKMIITTEEAITCGSQFLDFSSNTHHIADYSVALSRYKELTYNAKYEDTYRREGLGGAILLYANGTIGLRPEGGNQVKHLTLQEISEGIDFFCGGGYDYMGKVSGIVYNINIMNVSHDSITLEFFGCNNNGECDTKFKENRTSCPEDCPRVCGDGICEKYSETTEKDYCCEDCGCMNDLVCVNNVCVTKDTPNEELSDKKEVVSEKKEQPDIQHKKSKSSFTQRIIAWFKKLFGK